MRIVLTQSTMQAQRENLDKENSTLKADLEQMQWLQEQYEQMQEKVLKLIQQVYVTCSMYDGDKTWQPFNLFTFQERTATQNVNSLTHRLEQNTAK